MVERKSVTEQMSVDQAAPRLVLDRQLDAGNQAHAVPIEPTDGVDSRQRVVVGKGNHGKAGVRVGLDHLGRRQLPIAEDRVQVQVRPTVGYLSQWSPILCGIRQPHPAHSWRETGAGVI